MYANRQPASARSTTKFAIPSRLAGEVESPGFEKCLASKERGLLPEVAAFVCVTAQIDAIRSPAADTWAALFINDANGAAEDVYGGVFLEVAQDVIEGARSEAVVGVEIAEDVRGGGAEAFIQAVRRALVGFQDDAAEPPPVTLDHFAGTVGRSGIDHDIL